MQKYLKACRINPSLKNARRVRDYAAAHPMCRFMLDQDDCDLLDHVLSRADRGY